MEAFRYPNCLADAALKRRSSTVVQAACLHDFYLVVALTKSASMP
jgi:hypothetical protein